eukprot:169045_1
MATETSKSFPLGGRVILKDLQKGVEFNGQVGIIKSDINDSQRQQVLLVKSGKMLGLKPINLQYEPRTVNSLSITELKLVLSEKKVAQLSGYDKSQLRQMVEIKTDSGEEIAEIIYISQAKKAADAAAANAANASARGGGDLKSQMQNQAAAIGNMSPDQMRQQAQMLRTLPPSQIRRMNPQMAGFSDQQIQMAANQMEMMANNPQMMKGMVDQMKNMSDDEVENVRRMQAGGAPQPADQAPVGMGPGAGPGAGGQNIMDMSPEQLKQQAEMMKSMDPAMLKRMNPAMANWSDSQIQMAITQMETLANNPSMMKTMKEQMDGMDPEQIENMRKMAAKGDLSGADALGSAGMGGAGAGAANSTGAPGAPAMPSNPMDLLKNADPTQIKTMLKMVQDNPQLMKDMLKSANPGMADKMTDEQLQKTIDTFANLDDRKISMIMKGLGFFQKLKSSPKMKVAIFMMLSTFVFVLGMLVYLVKKSKSMDAAAATDSLVDEGVPPVPIIEESEF